MRREEETAWLMMVQDTETIKALINYGLLLLERKRLVRERTTIVCLSYRPTALAYVSPLILSLWRWYKRTFTNDNVAIDVMTTLDCSSFNFVTRKFISE